MVKLIRINERGHASRCTQIFREGFIFQELVGAYFEGDKVSWRSRMGLIVLLNGAPVYSFSKN